jgi:hypothetical protein
VILGMQAALQNRGKAWLATVLPQGKHYRTRRPRAGPCGWELPGNHAGGPYARDGP